MMKNLYPILFLVCLSISPGISAQTMVIRSMDGTEINESVLAVRKFSFSGENLMLLFKGGDIRSFEVATLTAIYFADIPQVTTTTDVAAGSSPTVYPNPADEVLNIGNVPEGNTTVTVYRLDGTPVLNSILPSGAALSVRDLPKGMYFLRVNGKTVKFIKL